MTAPIPTEGWEQDARCKREGEPADWTTDEPENGCDPALRVEYLRRVERAKAVCMVCPVQAACLEWAKRTEQDHNVLGGLTARERRKMTKGAVL